MTLHFTIWQLFALAISVAYLCILLRRFMSSRRVLRLGKECPRVQTRFPFGLDFPYNSVVANGKGQMLGLWNWIFDHTGTGQGGNASYTAELHMLVDSRIIFTADPENVKAVLIKQFQEFGKGEELHTLWKDLLGDSIFVADGQTWHFSRQLLRPMFARDRISDLPVIETHVRTLISLLGPGDGRRLRLDQLLLQFTLDAATEFLFGHSVGSMTDTESQAATAFDEAVRIKTLQSRLGPLRHFYTPKSLKTNIQTLEKFIEPFIMEALSLSREELEAKLSKTDSFIHALARNTRDRKVMRDQLIAVLIAARDTTAATLSWIFLELARNARVVEKIRAEIRDVVGSDKHPPTYENIKEMKYVTAVINETLRLHPVIMFNTRTSLTDTTIPRGGGPDGKDPVGCPKGTTVAFSPAIMGLRKDLYPPKSESHRSDIYEWVPERWTGWSPSAHSYIPFNAGPRVCIGQQFAMVEISYVVVRLLQEFDQVVDHGCTLTVKTQITSSPKDGVNVGFVKRDIHN